MNDANQLLTHDAPIMDDATTDDVSAATGTLSGASSTLGDAVSAAIDTPAPDMSTEETATPVATQSEEPVVTAPAEMPTAPEATPETTTDEEKPGML